jgi:hypothetical protein
MPVDVIREALVNSLCHRDYFRAESNKVAIFKDRIKIYNPGEFTARYEPSDYIHGDAESVHRNPLISEILYFSKDVERGVRASGGFTMNVRKMILRWSLGGKKAVFRPYFTESLRMRELSWALPRTSSQKKFPENSFDDAREPTGNDCKTRKNDGYW